MQLQIYCQSYKKVHPYLGVDLHIPDGFLNVPTIVATSAISAVCIGIATKQTSKKLGEKHIPMMGIMAAFIFVAQMLNFPIIGGTSGHFLGTALAAIVIGPWAAILIMTCILIVQCLIFQDGGLLALGANIFNMGIIGSLTGYYSFLLINKILGSSKKSMMFAWFSAGWISIMAAAIVCAIELAISGIIDFNVVFTAMVGWHTLIGIGEGLISISILSFILANRADLLKLEKV